MAGLAPSVYKARGTSITCLGGLTLGTDFSGVETPAWALKLLNIEYQHRFSSDVEVSCRKVAELLKVEKVYASVLGRDVTTMAYVDLYVFGLPCDPYSPNGSRLAHRDTKHGQLFMKSMEYISHQAKHELDGAIQAMCHPQRNSRVL